MRNRRALLTAWLATLIAPLSTAIAQPRGAPMPPPRVERRPPPPRGWRHPRWVPGRWRWNGRRWVWQNGRWTGR